MSVSKNLLKLDDQVIQNKNFVKNFLPFRSQSSGLDFEAIAGNVLATAFRKRLGKDSTLESYKSAVFERLRMKLTDQEFEPFIEKMYFNNDASGLFKVSPEFLIFKAAQAEASTNKHVAQILIGFIGNSSDCFRKLSSEVNFLEQELLEEFQKRLVDLGEAPVEYPYLPFVAEYFTQDLSFLLEHPGYFLENLRLFFNLYTFLYSSQLALNINSWTEAPESKPLFFILDSEKASLERKYVRESFPLLKTKALDLFPLLSMLEYLNNPQDKRASKFPLWKVFLDIENMSYSERAEVGKSLAELCQRYRNRRQLPIIQEYPETIKGLFGLLSRTAKEIFQNKGTSQYDVNTKFVNTFENEIASDFIQVRGRSGRVLTISQDYLLLLTNLAIGRKKQVQFQELLHELKKRGVWFDRQSEQAIIRFLERIGNVERMSDSGDAVYVRKTL
ncbi:MAG: DNA phosphorothioation-dependent restriction protein DptG [Halomonas sp.]|uniref:DNA phosphorothioation-dependent restriction protein DptG n=3 Tax=Halomonas TaxID=2745 RepID=A0ABR9G227_9GAMM|nr:DNA phosphorothioation-dependent restriction protein DptG [Halomonas colorata]MBE0464949.1 DNA phosphorothioation-dependent restriction protein DptG [Halomonas colorata]